MKALVVGCGSIGRRHLRNLVRLDVTELAVADPNVEGVSDLPADVTRYATLEEGLAWKPEIAVIASPSEFHIPQAIEAARRGCHVFVEKPLSHTLDLIDTLVRELDGKQSLVGCNMRFHPGPATVKQLLGENAIGELIAARIKTGSYLPDWRPRTDYKQSYSASRESGGAILDCIHEIDLACWLLGPARLAASARRPAKTLGLETDGLAELILDHESGVLSSVHLNFVQRDYRRTCEVVGSEGTIHWDFAEQKVWINRDGATRAANFPQPENWEINDMYVDEMAHFIDCVKAGKETCNPVAKALPVLEIALAARK